VELLKLQLLPQAPALFLLVESMAHYAFLDENNLVVEVIVGKDEGSTDWEQHYESFRKLTCKRTSYNTTKGVHTKGGVPFRKNFAGIGYTFDASLDAFIPPKPFSSWVLNKTTCDWDAPVSYPDDGDMYRWDETGSKWVAVES
jgi:hypothetical protein